MPAPLSGGAMPAEQTPPLRRWPLSTFRKFFAGEASGGVVLLAAAILALIVANTPLAGGYFAALHAQLGPYDAEHWINDGLMALFFLLVGLEIKREMLGGELATWRRRALPGLAALGGMAVPAAICAAFTFGNAEALRGWAVPAATDIAFAVAAISALGRRVPPSLRVFLTALAIIDDLGAVVIIALFYAHGLSLPDLLGAAVVLVLLFVLNRRGVRALWPYLGLGIVLWVFVDRSGLHATLAGVALALAVPLRVDGPSVAPPADAPLFRLEHALDRIVPFVVVPIFGFANAGLSFAGASAASLLQPLPLGIALGLLVGKPIGVTVSAAVAVRAGIAEFPAAATWRQFIGVAQLCGIGFTMSLFISLLAFTDNVALQEAAKLGILGGSVVSGVVGMAILAAGRRGTPPMRM